MKKLLLLALAGAAVLLACWGVVAVVQNHYQDHQNKKQAVVQSQVSAAAESAKRAQYVADRASFSLLAKQYDKVLAECKKGEAAYALLTPFGQTKVLAPVCPAARAQ